MPLCQSATTRIYVHLIKIRHSHKLRLGLGKTQDKLRSWNLLELAKLCDVGGWDCLFENANKEVTCTKEVGIAYLKNTLVLLRKKADKEVTCTNVSNPKQANTLLEGLVSRVKRAWLADLYHLGKN